MTPRGFFGKALAVAFAAVVLFTGTARADDAADTNALFAGAVKALHEGRAGDAIAAFETLADDGVVDAAASYDRGLAYAQRVRIGAEVPGDLGRAAQGFEEARDLSTDPKLTDDASNALHVVRAEIARRRLRSGDRVEVDPGRTLSRTLAALLPESAWSALAVLLSVALATGLFARWLGAAARLRIGGGVLASVAAPVLAIAVGMTLAARHDRLTLREAVVVATGARPNDARGIALPGATPLPEGARVEIVEARGAATRVRFGVTDAWVSSSTLRELARPD
ncbi:MAG TPA: hypothetical protein VHV30_11995 [Polyangiaceae bacterium]|jgi:hypothetical protein|nr:hypothetical protein [Polyangiaceae bacterium]